MAIDTRDKRCSAINVASPWRSMWPAPDGTISQGDRQQIAFMYSGIAAASVVEPEGPILVAERRNMVISAPKRHMVVTTERRKVVVSP